LIASEKEKRTRLLASNEWSKLLAHNPVV